MKPWPYPEISNQEHEGFVKPIKKGPLPGILLEKKIISTVPQKYQFYEGRSSVIGSPFNENGAK